MTEETESRRDQRLSVKWQGVLASDDYPDEMPCEVLDISEAGALIRADIKPGLETDLLLTIDGLGEFAGRVRWVGSQEIGLMLLVGSDLDLKKFAEPSGADLSEKPAAPIDLAVD